MFDSASVFLIRLYVLILCATYFSNGATVTWVSNFPGNVTRYKRQATCGPRSFVCNSGQCVTEESFCNGKEECEDGSDENDCPNIPCNNRLFRCAYGACINKNLECNGVKDCKDNSDETSPKCNSTGSGCSDSQFRCDSGECILNDNLCNGIPHCADFSDESSKHCSDFPCPRATFRCGYGACVGKRAKCNGIKDCFDGSDEKGCPATVPPKPDPSPIPSTPPPPGFCVMPNNPPNGIYTVGNLPAGTYKPGTAVSPFMVLVTQCNYGHKPTPPDKLGRSICSNEIWGPEPSKCSLSCQNAESSRTTKITCTFEGRELNSCENPVENTFATIECEPPFEEPSLIHQPLRKCRDGSWDRPIPQCYAVCGVKRPKGITNIIGGQIATQGDYPWHAGIYRSKNHDHICGGSIISEQVVISAAHCFVSLDNGQKFPKEDFLVAAGKYFRTYYDPRDKNAQYSNVQNIHIPTRYKGALTLHEADIAIVILVTKLEFSIAVQPVCVDWNTAFEYQQISGDNFGVVVGWGQTVEGSTPSEVLKELHIPVVPYDQCFDQVPKPFRPFLTHDKVCAGYLDNATAACQGDSGGGLTFPNKQGRYYIRGVVSTSPSTNDGFCDSNQYATYTLVSKYIDFIKLYGF